MLGEQEHYTCRSSLSGLQFNWENSTSWQTSHCFWWFKSGKLKFFYSATHCNYCFIVLHLIIAFIHVFHLVQLHLLRKWNWFWLTWQPTLPATGRHLPRMGNLGHITRIANKLVQMGNANDQIHSYLQVNMLDVLVIACDGVWTYMKLHQGSWSGIGNTDLLPGFLKQGEKRKEKKKTCCRWLVQPSIYDAPVMPGTRILHIKSEVSDTIWHHMLPILYYFCIIAQHHLPCYYPGLKLFTVQRMKTCTYLVPIIGTGTTQ